MAAIRQNLQQELFRPNEEALYSVVNVEKLSGGKKKKATFLCAAVTKEKPFQVRIYKVQKSEKEVFKKKHCWQLTDLKVVDGKNSKQDCLEFDLQFEKVYHWVASRTTDRNEFIETLWMLGKRYGGSKKPEFKNVSQHILEGDPSDRIHTVVKATQPIGSQEGQEDYQKLTPKEENDLNTILGQFEDALTNVEIFTDQLSSELQELEYINITSLMGSEQQAKDLLSLIDKSVEELNQLDDRLTFYDDCLQKVGDQMGQMEFKDNRMEIERTSNKKLLEEIKYIVGKLDISQRHIRSLREGDLYTPLGIEECISAAKILLVAFHTQFNPGIAELRAVQDQLANITNLKAEFAQRIYTHLDKFISQHSNIDGVSYKFNSDLSLQPHDSVHDDFLPYVDLMKWLKDLDNSKYLEIKAHYEKSFTLTYEKEFKEYLEVAKLKASMKVKGGKSSHSLTSVHSHEQIGPVKSKSGLSRFRKESKLKRSPSKESIDSMASVESSSSSFAGTATSTQFETVFDVILSELEPYVSAEQQFCTLFFHLRYPGDNYKESPAELPTDIADGAMLSTGRPPRAANVDEVRDMMKNIFGFLDVELQSFISFGESLHPHNILYAMYRIQNQASHLVTSQSTGAPPTFLGTLFGGWLVCTKRCFDKYIETMCRHISELRVQKKKRTGILPDVVTVEKFFKASEHIFRGSERRVEIDKAYQKLIQILFEKIEHVAEENDKPPPEIVMFENYHYLHGVIRGLKNTSLENEKKQAEQNYYDAMHQYILTRLGRPLDRMSRFFQGVESCINSGVRMEDIGYQLALNQQELRNVIKEYPPKEVKKGLELLHKKIEKYVTEAGLTQVLWHNLQEAFVRQYERYQELVELCYPNSNIKLPVTIKEILEFFSNIAQSH
ncbi:exocyst complex component 1-like isoform X2 [Hydractinia symbiolongicarpus]|uniref:exocyst complex component 1-like isoform X2 n=1 Tax=Hydractinia symbiolongicarpus TaxID=13093 RepID=UPI00254C200D|nr:exocyst complex component 1-like isoform X2 [Hydractinia symbiolongicarpus]